MLKVAMAQIVSVVGAFDANVKRIQAAYDQACLDGARVLLTPEMGVCGYPPNDLVERPEMIECNERALLDLASFTRGKSCALVVGHMAPNPSRTGRPVQNRATVLENGKAVFSQAKMLLPTYDVLDEARYFEPAAEVRLWNCDDRKVGIAICEDLWGKDPHFGRRLYALDPVDFYRDQNIEILFSISSSPYEWGKREHRERLHRQVVESLKVPLVYVNQVGATDEILFDGSSFALNAQGQILERFPCFKSFQRSVWVSSHAIASAGDLIPAGVQSSQQVSSILPSEDPPPSEMEGLARGLVCGIREYFSRTGFKSALLGLSGGIDSAVVATLAVEALGEKNVLGIAMPSQYSSSHSLQDAEALARNLKISLEVHPIKFQYSTLARELAEGRGALAPVALENLQSRLRAICLMTLANHEHALVLTTGNKSELATGYCTLYGDMAGALAPIGDLFKTRVYELARYLNQVGGGKIPVSSIEKAPSAELRPNQTDQDTLPAYEILDEILLEYIEKGTSIQELESRFKPGQVKNFGGVRELLRRFELNEYKRRQGAPVLKVSRKAFGMGRRIPLSKKWDWVGQVPEV